MPKPHRRSKRRQQEAKRKRKAKIRAHVQPFPEPVDASVLSAPSERTDSQPAAPRRVPVERCDMRVYLKGASLTPAQEARARELGFTVNKEGRWHRPLDLD